MPKDKDYFPWVYDEDGETRHLNIEEFGGFFDGDIPVTVTIQEAPDA
jgi:hypothetical protein